MNLIVCLDDKNGMMFNNRRQSRDKEVTAYIKRLCENHKLYISKYSYVLVGFGIVCDNPINECEKGDFCFIENTNLPNDINLIERLIVFKWNRNYPSDKKFNLNFSDFKMVNSFDFAGYSHEIITMEEYEIV